MVARKIIKILHTLSAIGYTGGILAYLAVLLSAPEVPDLGEHLLMRRNIVLIVTWAILPSTLIVLISGLASMMAHSPFMNAPWVWLKLLAGVLVFEASLASIAGPAKASLRAVERAVAGDIDINTMNGLLQDKWTAMYVLLGISVANVVLGVWRPRFGQRL